MEKMKTTSATPSSRKPLQYLVNKLAEQNLAAAEKAGSRIISQIDTAIQVDTRDIRLVTLIGELLETVVNHSRNGDIHITADRYLDVVILSIQERNNYNGYALSYSIQSYQPEVSVLGGHISINGAQQRVATISFSFPVPVAAA